MLWAGKMQCWLGRFEDQFFSTVFIGSGLMFLAMIFAAAGAAGALVVAATEDPAEFVASTTYSYAPQTVAQILTIYALRMAAVFQMSQATLWLRTHVMPRWMAALTFLVAVVLLFVFAQTFGVALIFPGWVLLVSAYILVVRLRARAAAKAGGQSQAA